MGLLDQVLGSVLNQGAVQEQQQQRPSGGGLGGIISMVARNPQLVQMLIGMLSNNRGGSMGRQAPSAGLGGGGMGGGLGGLGGLLAGMAGGGAALGGGMGGGLGGLMAQFEQAGMGGAMQSWIGSGDNQEISGQQVSQAFGNEQLNAMVAELNMPASDVADQMAQLLPGLVNHFTPDGQVPADGLGNSDDMLARLGAELGPR